MYEFFVRWPDFTKPYVRFVYHAKELHYNDKRKVMFSPEGIGSMSPRNASIFLRDYKKLNTHTNNIMNPIFFTINSLQPTANMTCMPEWIIFLKYHSTCKNNW
jgi:hypothetical protein